MKTYLAIAAIAAFSLSTFGAHAAEKQMQLESWSFGCSNPAMATGQGGSAEARPGYDLKKGTKISERTTQACPSDDVKAPRDVATGLATGKRMHTPVR